MEKLTYRQAYDKIIEAYFKDEIQPYNRKFCFCGTLVWQRDEWDSSVYDMGELQKMENALLKTISKKMALFIPEMRNNKFANLYDEQARQSKTDWLRNKLSSHPNYEAALFIGMVAALDVLKEIHRQRGENVDEIIPAFTKRELQKSKSTSHEAQTQT